MPPLDPRKLCEVLAVVGDCLSSCSLVLVVLLSNSNTKALVAAVAELHCSPSKGQAVVVVVSLSKDRMVAGVGHCSNHSKGLVLVLSNHSTPSETEVGLRSSLCLLSLQLIGSSLSSNRRGHLEVAVVEVLSCRPLNMGLAVVVVVVVQARTRSRGLDLVLVNSLDRDQQVELKLISDCLVEVVGEVWSV